MITEREKLHSHILKLSRLVDEKDNVIKNLRKDFEQMENLYFENLELIKK